MNTNFDGAAVAVDLEQMKHLLSDVPRIDERAGSSTYLKMPLVNGELVTYRFFETTVMAPALSNRFPTIKSYMGFGIENPSHRASIIINNNTLIGMTISAAGESFFESFNLNDDNNIVQVSRELIEDIEMICNIKETVSHADRDATDFPDCMGTDDPCNPVGIELVTYMCGSTEGPFEQTNLCVRRKR